MQSFDEKIKQQQKYDEAAFRDSIYDVANAVMPKHLEESLKDEEVAIKAVDAILKFYLLKNKITQIPNEVKGIDKKIDYCMRSYGILRRNVVLSKGWYKNAVGAMLTTRKSDGKTIVLIPGRVSGYLYLDVEKDKYGIVNKINENLFSKEAVCLYMPLPMKKFTIKDLFIFAFKLLNLSDILVYLGSMAVVSLLGLLSPTITYMLFGPTLNSKSIQALIAISIFMICYSCTQALVNAFQSLFNSRVSTKINIAIESAVMGRILSLPASFFRKYPSGDLAQRATYMQSLCKTLMSSVVSTSLTSLFSLIYVFQIFNYAPALALPAIIITFCTVLITILSTFFQVRINRKKMKLYAKESGMTYSMITGIQKIKQEGAEKRMFSRWAKLYAKVVKLEYNPPLFLKINSVITFTISSIGTLILYALAIYSNVSVSEYYAFNTAYGMVAGAFAGLTGIVGLIANIGPSLEMVKPIMDTTPQISENKKIITHLSGAIDVDHVCFRYAEDMPLVLNDFCLKVKPGEYLGIVGETGCGKSTLLRLLLGFEFPQKGAVYYDKYTTKQVDLMSLCQNIGVVLQDGKLFIGDIYSNIAISCPSLTLDGAWEAAEIAQIADDIRQMPMGMATHISEGQGGISGGQKQRLMIARAVANKPKIIMMDESTSALDNLTQKKVSDAIDSLHCTRIVIAHRLSTIKNCDRIVVLNKGKITEFGTYDELIKKNGLFATLVERQRLDLK